ncbi:hypothetical protein RJT34_30237 [Clitoria ternatea]|uniref:DUF4283 domain-containing protein n=1 Tax=Clitoria ternatea TaxID=43366 RepID=A0AAN9ESD9_CLITE
MTEDEDEDEDDVPENKWYKDIPNVDGPFNACLEINNKLQQKWVMQGAIKVIDILEDIFLIQFSNLEDYSHTLFEGPWMITNHYLIVEGLWMITNHYLIVQHWRLEFLDGVHIVTMLACRVRIPNLNIELYHKKFL